MTKALTGIPRFGERESVHLTLHRHQQNESALRRAAVYKPFECVINLVRTEGWGEIVAGKGGREREREKGINSVSKSQLSRER